jgi:hypothetical protein
VRAPSKGLSTRNVVCIEPIVICACGLLPNSAKVPNFNIGHDYALWIRNFMMMMKKLENLDFETLQWPTAIIRPKSRKSNIRHDGILSIVNFMLMINNHFARFQLPGNLLKTKKMCSPFSWQYAISFLFFVILVLETKLRAYNFENQGSKCRGELGYTHTEKIRNTDRGCRLWEVKNSGCNNSSPTEVKRTFIHQNLSICIAKSMRNFCHTKSSPQNQRTYI